MILPKQLTTLNVQNSPTINLAAGGAFIVQDSTGANLAVIDSTARRRIVLDWKPDAECAV